ncbi:MAG: serpin family protein [Anaerolineales bacterium]
MKIALLSLLLISLLISSACQPEQKPTESTPEGEISRYIKSDLARETAPEVDPDVINALAEDNAAFALAFYNQVQAQHDNLIFSPLSLSLALSMAMAGAEGDTQRAMMDTLQFSMPEEEVHPAFNALLLAIEASQGNADESEQEGGFQLSIANSIWGQAGYDFKATFLDILAQNYGSGLYLVDFIGQPEQARATINQWVADETKEKIKDLLPQGAIDTLTRLVLANAIYFKGAWRYPFEVSNTKEEPFNLLDGSETLIDMMHLSGSNLPYLKGEGFQAISLPYVSTDFQMTLLVPDVGNFAAFEEILTPDKLSSLASEMTFKQVNLGLPKFDFNASINANNPLAALGMGEAFDYDKADFSGITDADELAITDVLHKATITVDEEGTEAAAATAVVIGIRSMPSDEPITLVIDRPFIFFIEHQPTHAMLFMGRVTQP